MPTTATFACIVCTILVNVFGHGELTRVGMLMNETWYESVDSYYRWNLGTFYPHVY